MLYVKQIMIRLLRLCVTQFVLCKIIIFIYSGNYIYYVWGIRLRGHSTPHGYISKRVTMADDTKESDIHLFDGRVQSTWYVTEHYNLSQVIRRASCNNW